MSKRNLVLIFATGFFFLSVFALKMNSPQKSIPQGVPLSETPRSEVLSTKTDLPSESVNLILVGDIMLGRTVMIKSLSLNDSSYPFRKVAGRLKEGNLVFANLENPIIDDCPKMETGMVFCALPVMLDGLVYSGVNIVSLANNHTKNFGVEGYENTKQELKARGIDWVDERNLVIKNVKGVRYGFLGFDFTTKAPTSSDFDFIKDSKAKVDILIAGIHWGGEYTSIPSDSQKTWAKEIIESGVDVISGHHSHWIQTIESIEGKPVYYSLGNFVFDQMWSDATKKGLTVNLTFDNNKIVNEVRNTIYMTSWAQPEFVD